MSSISTKTRAASLSPRLTVTSRFQAGSTGLTLKLSLPSEVPVPSSITAVRIRLIGRPWSELISENWGEMRRTG